VFNFLFSMSFSFFQGSTSGQFIHIFIHSFLLVSGHLDKILEVGEDFIRVEPGTLWPANQEMP